jgi:hypothetical protein
MECTLQEVGPPHLEAFNEMFIEGLLPAFIGPSQVVGVPDIPEHLRKKLEQVGKEIWRSKKYGGQKKF